MLTMYFSQQYRNEHLEKDISSNYASALHILYTKLNQG